MKKVKEFIQSLIEKIEKFIETNFRSNTFKLIFGVGCIAILSCIAIVLVIKIFYNRSFDYLDYVEKSKTDYRVNLKKNDYYEVEHLPSGMNYIASLIQDIDVDFDYSFNTNSDINYDLSYYVEAVTRVYGDKDKATVLFEKSETILPEKNIKKENIQYSAFRETVTVDYAKFNNFVKAFKTSYALNANSDVTIILHVNGTGISKEFDDTIDINGEASIVVPLTEQTLNITINSKNINKVGKLSKKSNFNLGNLLYIIMVLIILLIDILIIYKIILVIDRYLKSITKYQKRLNKILREYDSVIANVKNNIDTTDYQFIKVASFEELLDVHDNVGAPILFNEVVPGKVSHFIIISDNLLYRYVLKEDEA